VGEIARKGERERAVSQPDLTGGRKKKGWEKQKR
jgi:hypothetical protein